MGLVIEGLRKGLTRYLHPKLDSFYFKIDITKFLWGGATLGIALRTFLAVGAIIPMDSAPMPAGAAALSVSDP